MQPPTPRVVECLGGEARPSHRHEGSVTVARPCKGLPGGLPWISSASHNTDQPSYGWKSCAYKRSYTRASWHARVSFTMLHRHSESGRRAPVWPVSPLLKGPGLHVSANMARHAEWAPAVSTDLYMRHNLQQRPTPPACKAYQYEKMHNSLAATCCSLHHSLNAAVRLRRACTGCRSSVRYHVLQTQLQVN